MPWTIDNPPRPAKNWSPAEISKCVAAANAVMTSGGSDQDAIFACIHAAGKSKRRPVKKEVYQTHWGKKIHASDFAHAGDKDDSSTALYPGVYVDKSSDGRYIIEAVSTAALKDREGETFTVECMDWDISEAEKSGNFPEFRMFHSPALGIGRVTKMRRVGIFAIDTGIAYDDQFSQYVCKTLLENNTGKWRTSRGFRVHEASGTCPVCGEGIVVGKEHMLLGFVCPICKKTFVGYRSVLGGVTFRKARTFDVTITDNPAVPWTSAAAYKEELEMTKKELEDRLLKAGVPKDIVAQRLKIVSDEALKEFVDIPDATLLKQLGVEATETAGDDSGDVLYLDDEVIKEIGNLVRAEIQEALKELEIEIPDVELTIPGIGVVLTEMKELRAAVATLLEDDDTKVAKQLAGVPRGAGLRVHRYKAMPVSGKKNGAEDDEEEEDDEEDDEEDEMPVAAKQVFGPGDNGIHSMTEWLFTEEK